MGCKELFLRDIVRVDLVLDEECEMLIPWNVPMTTEMVSPAIGRTSLCVGMTDDECLTAVCEDKPTIKLTEQRVAFGNVFGYELSVTATDGLQAVREARRELEGKHFHIFAETQGGTCYLCYAMPNTCKISIDEQMGNGDALTLKASVSSMSPFVKILFGT